jgi:hypothetical protein
VEANQTPLSPREVEAFVDMLMTGDQATVFGQITEHLKNGKAIRSLADTIQIGAGELILRNTVPRAFTDGQHPFDYCNTANFWLRTCKSPYQPRILYMMANFVNESIIEGEFASYDFSNRAPDSLLTELGESILAFDIARSTAVAHAYLQSGADRSKYMATVALAACKFQDDPHNQKISHSAFQEYENNSTHLRDRLLLVAVRQLAGWPKMPGERDCYARFLKDWIRN